MIPEAHVAEILAEAPSLASAGRMLIDAANDAGGRDNITVVLFRLEEIAAGAPVPQETAEHRALAREPAEPERRPRRQRAAGAAGAAAPATATVAAPVARKQPRPARRGAPARRRRRPRVPVGPILVLFLVACVILGAYYASQTVYFVGTSDDGFVTVYRGLPYDLPAGLDLYSVNYESGVPVDELTPRRQQQTVTEHTLRSTTTPQDLVRQLETGELAR